MWFNPVRPQHVYSARLVCVFLARPWALRTGSGLALRTGPPSIRREMTNNARPLYGLCGRGDQPRNVALGCRKSPSLSSVRLRPAWIRDSKTRMLLHGQELKMHLNRLSQLALSRQRGMLRVTKSCLLAEVRSTPSADVSPVSSHIGALSGG
ncbi:hypothetical protein BDP81DRAFT_57073 [Colletotrichum phormii]|uniref:Uncharacterized protein n=1 Tax=Colletotrichum phormii TaxID=359342 RepID=A0AAJ0ED47_9PEZI|nr:uncharacterized protein BDP81DRAFT_57073 [Colletotrichum phormii]KAK1634313.1 hypothetical protein BDP81DRAFT_57073 [Colletotrichum phormii]